MADQDVMIVKAGMMTAVGLSAEETAASVRAGIMGFTDLTWRGVQFEPFKFAEVLEDGLPPLVKPLEEEIGLTAREIRLHRLAEMPLRECLEPALTAGKKVGLILSLPERETLKPISTSAFLSRLAKQAGGIFDLGQTSTGPRGRAGGLLALEEARQRLESRRAELLVVGGVDTFRDLFLLGMLEKDQRLRTPFNGDGFIPGEGAGFLLLCTRRTAAVLGWKPLARISAIAEGNEPGHLTSSEPYKGEGLAEAVAKYFEKAGSKELIGEVYSSMNGESYWAKEWSVAFLRHQKAFSPQLRIQHPADCFGDIGSAVGPVMVGLAALGINKGYRRSPCLVYGSSDQGQRAVLSVALS